MEEDHLDQDYVAPLTIRKPSRDNISPTEDDEPYDAVAFEENYSPRPRFQNFLRASYPFHPTATPSPSTVTLELNAGDIILVHSIHTNGWADGTLLETGARGWLPTNYCEPYDYATIRPLLKALTEFWDIIRSGSETNEAIFHNHDYMRGMVAGVRYLLEKSDCLTREAVLVKQDTRIRKTRKLLLSDLSNLVKTAKHLQQMAAAGASVTEVEEVLDDMLLKAFQVVTRAVAFFDIWTDWMAFANVNDAERPVSLSRSHSMFSNSWQSQTTTSTLSSDQTARQQSQQSFPDDVLSSSRNRPLSVSSVKKPPLTHRMSYTGRLNQSSITNLASERLNSSYDAFLGVLASFLGSHMQSRSSSELLLTTQQAVRACRRLLTVVDLIVDHDIEHADQLIEAKDTMCDKITELVLAAKQVFRPLQSSEEEMFYLPSEGIQLVGAATACVSGAGRCVAKARIILEVMGDFEFDTSNDTEVASPVEPSPSPTIEDYQFSPDPNTCDSPDLTSKPRLEISTSMDAPTASDETSPTPDTSMFWTPVAGPTNHTAYANTLPNTQSIASTNSAKMPFGRPFPRDLAHSTDSESTLVSSARNSGPSVISDTSTRATSPERHDAQPAKSLDDAESRSSSDELEGEEEIMQLIFAHELLFHPEGRVVGGSLNAIIERLTAHDSTPDAFFVSTIYLTFRLFTTPKEFLQCLTHRFDIVAQTPKIAQPVRLRVYNVLKGWLETHWRHDCDESVLPQIVEFARHAVLPVLPPAGKRLLELVETVARTHQPPVPRILSAVGKTSTSTTDFVNPDSPMPPPILSKSQLSALKVWKSGGSALNILDFDPLEIARQITIKESSIFCSILPEELLSTEFTKQSSSLAVNVRAMAQLSTDLANLVADSILQLEEPKKRAAVVKQWIKVASKCLELNNYDTLMAIVCSINSSTILRLRRTWDLISQKTQTCFDGLKKVVDVSKNYSTLRQRVAGHVPPCIPFVGMYLTDLTFVDHGNPATRELKTGDDTLSVINLDKHMKTARIISDLQRFQSPYRLSEVSELQTWLQDELVRVRAAGERNFQNHYRRSLVLEPREQTQPRPTTMGTFAAITSHKEKFDFLAWTHIGKDKSTSVHS